MGSPQGLALRGPDLSIVDFRVAPHSADRLPAGLRRAIAEVATTPALLVACEYETALVRTAANDPRPVAESVHALRALAALPATTCAVTSAQPLRDLAAVSRLPAEVRLVGSNGGECEHGSWWRDGAESALDDLRHRGEATAAVLLGGDGNSFAVRNDADLEIPVALGDMTHAVADPSVAALVLALLFEERRCWLFGGDATPIERLSMLSNRRSVALMSPEARLVWFCHPEPDSAAVFADLLGGPRAGHFSVRPERGGLPLGQQYVPGTMSVRTRWPRLAVTDYLAHDTPPDRTDLVRVISGDTPAALEFAPRPEFGQVPVRLARVAGGLRVLGTANPMVLRSPGVEWEISSDGHHESARAIVRLNPEQPLVLELRCGTDTVPADDLAEPQRRQSAESHWSQWLAGLRLPETERELVARSALTLRGLCHDSGGVLAAATTSLPEEAGGVRNWDYRYCWLRDAALTVQALVSLGSISEADAFLEWVHAVVDALPGPERLRPLYTLRGGALPPEAVLESLPGYAGSRPVRVGNLADQQVQLDVFGPITELVAQVSDVRGRLRDRDWQLVVAMAEAVTRRWHEPDHGIWEERHAPRHRVYSKVMCWVTIDRAITLATRFGREVDESWPSLREHIAAEVLARGWNAEVRAFTTAYDGTDLDAASLHIGLSGLVDPAGQRFQDTVTAIEAELRSGPVVHRYRRDDGLPGEEGGFHLCTAWLIEAYLRTGRRTDAEVLFKQLADCAGPTGLLPEEYDPIHERSLGNHPQAYSHVGLIRCAQLLDD